MSSDRQQTSDDWQQHGRTIDELKAALAANEAEIATLKTQIIEREAEISSLTSTLAAKDLEIARLKEKAECADECYKVLSVNGGKGFTDEMGWKPQTDLGKVCAKTVRQLMKSMEAASAGAGGLMKERDHLQRQRDEILAEAVWAMTWLSHYAPMKWVQGRAETFLARPDVRAALAQQGEKEEGT